MGRVLGDSSASASSTNGCGTALRCLTANRASCSGRKGIARRGFDIGLRIPDLLSKGDRVAGREASSLEKRVVALAQPIFGAPGPFFQVLRNPGLTPAGSSTAHFYGMPTIRPGGFLPGCRPTGK